MKNLQTPYFAVIFTSKRLIDDIGNENTSYAEMANRMLELAAQQPGYLGVDSVRENGKGITVSYWSDEKSIQHWKEQMEHQQAQKLGKTRWYDNYSVRVAKVERSYNFVKGE